MIETCKMLKILEESKMSSNLQTAFNNLKELEGADQGYGEWFEVDQNRINDFAAVSYTHLTLPTICSV